MGRTAKIVAVAVLGALVLTLALVTAVSPPVPGASASQISRADAPSRNADVPARCRVAVEADLECTAVWDEKRRRFFGNQDETK